MELEDVIAAIIRLEKEREAIYQDDQVTPEEHPRLTEINRELDRLWDLRRRLEAARNAGLDKPPIPPPSDASKLIG